MTRTEQLNNIFFYVTALLILVMSYSPLRVYASSYSRDPSGTEVTSPVSYTITYDTAGEGAAYWSVYALTLNDEAGTTNYPSGVVFANECFPIEDNPATFTMDIAEGVSILSVGAYADASLEDCQSGTSAIAIDDFAFYEDGGETPIFTVVPDGGGDTPPMNPLEVAAGGIGVAVLARFGIAFKV